MLTGFDAYKIYVSLKTHFAGKRDYVKYGLSNIAQNTFMARNDRYQFEKLARKYNTQQKLESFLISVFRDNPKLWVGKCFEKECQEIHNKRLSVLEAMEYRFKQDLSFIQDYLDKKNLVFADIVKVNEGSCLLWTWRMQNSISFETFCILNRLLRLEALLDSRMQENITWKEYICRYNAYTKLTPEMEDKKWSRILSEFLVQNDAGLNTTVNKIQ